MFLNSDMFEVVDAGAAEHIFIGVSPAEERRIGVGAQGRPSPERSRREFDPRHPRHRHSLVSRSLAISTLSPPRQGEQISADRVSWQ
jgi:hypothetical protein